MWCKESNKYFDRIESLVYGEIKERSFSNPHPRVLVMTLYTSILARDVAKPSSDRMLTVKLNIMYVNIVL